MDQNVDVKGVLQVVYYNGHEDNITEVLDLSIFGVAFRCKAKEEEGCEGGDWRRSSRKRRGGGGPMGLKYLS